MGFFCDMYFESIKRALVVHNNSFIFGKHDTKYYTKSSWFTIDQRFLCCVRICGKMTVWNQFHRSSRPEVFCKKGVLRNFAKFTRKRLCQSHVFNKVTGLRPATLLKKWLWHRCFPVKFAKFLRTPFIIEHLRWLLLISN